MLVLIQKDESTHVPREVADMAEARALAAQGMPVYLQDEDGNKTLVESEEPAGEEAEPVEAAAPAAKSAPAKKAARKR